MDNTKHTPGPWRTNSKTNCIESAHEDYQFSLIAKIATGEDQYQEDANTRLIAAAPEMYDCLQGLIDEIERCGVKVSAELELLANQAIARVEGEL